ncbi:MAG: P-loop NTPase [Anaerolineales bacterium]|jgi:CO dehydrogenase maturation factor
MMSGKKISICGKGGCGKSTIVVLMAQEMSERGYRVVVVDSDESNTGLARMLGFETRPTPLLDLVGGKKNVFPTFSEQAEPSSSILTQEALYADELPSPYISEANGIRLVCIGKILQSLEGCACPMGVLSREFLGRLTLAEDEMALVDMEAGIEHFGRGVETSVDDVLIIVDPSYESLELAQRIHALATEVGAKNVWAILNRVNSKEIEQKLHRVLEGQGIAVLGSIAYDPEIFQAGLEGRPIMGSSAAGDIAKIIDGLLKQG